MITRNRPDGAAACARRLRALPDAPRVVVVDQGDRPVPPSHDHLTEVISLGTNLGAAGRNVGVAACDEPFIAFSDDDSWWAPGALRRAVELFDAHPDVGLLAASVVVEPAGHVDPFCDLLAASPLEGPGPGVPILGFMACAVVVRRRAFEEAGGFPEGFGVGGEEARLALDLASAGWRLQYVPDLVAHHHPGHGGRDGRSRREVRNELWTAWQRLPTAVAARHTWRTLAAQTPRTAAAALVDALGGLPDAVRQRRVVPAAVARDWQKLADES